MEVHLRRGHGGPRRRARICVLVVVVGLAVSAVPQALAAGSLSGSVSEGTSLIDLTAEGTTDWAVWGYSSTSPSTLGQQCTVDGSCSTSLAPDVRKAGAAGGISDLVNVDTGDSAPLRGLGFDESTPFSFSWSVGSNIVGDGAAAGARTGIQHNGQVLHVSSVGKGFSFQVPADTTLRTVKIWVSAHSGTGQLTAALSDASATSYVDSTIVGPPNGGNVPGLYTITYAASSPGQTLNVSWVESSSSDFTYYADNVALYGVALAGPPPPPPPPSDPTQTGPFTVNSTADPGDGACTVSNCTLREAIAAANGHPNGSVETPDSIVFNLSGGPQTTVQVGGLPSITDPVVIDGSLGDGFVASINGDGAGTADGLVLAAGSGGSTIRNLLIGDFALGAGVRILSSGNTVESSVLRTSQNGVVVAGGSNNVIGYNLGPDQLSSIGLIAPNRANVVTSNSGAGIFVTGGASGTRIVGNYVGTNTAGASTGLANGTGIHVVRAASNQIGPGNTIAYNGVAGVDVQDDTATSVGTNGTHGNRIVANSIHDNGSKGIVLRSANRGIEAPAIDSATTANEATTVSGSITGSSGTYFVELFSNTTCDTTPPGAGEGKTYLDFAQVTLDGASGTFSKAIPELPNGTVLTATLTRADTGDTSEFSACQAVSEVPLVTNGGFEQPVLPAGTSFVTKVPGSALTGWTIDSGSIDHIREYWAPFAGQQSLDLGGNAAGSISQPIETVEGQAYQISFAYSTNPDRPSGDAAMDVRWGGATVLHVTHPKPPSYTNMNWTRGAATVVGTGAPMTLRFASTDTSGGAWGIALDDVSVTIADSPPPLVTNLGITGPSSANAGAAEVPLAGIPPSALVLPQTNGTQAAPVNQSPVNQSPVNQLPVNQLPVNQSPVNQSPVNQLPVNQSPVNQLGLGPNFQSLVTAPGPLGDTALSTIPLLRTNGWSGVLPAPLKTTPLQSVTLRQVFSLSPLPAPLQPGASNPIRFADIDFSHSPLGSLPAMTLALGQLPLSGIPGVDWCSLFSGPPINCPTGGSLPTGTSLLSAALQGAPVNQSPVNQSPVNQSLIDALAAAQAPVNQLPVNQLPVNQLPVNQLPVNQSRILSFPVNQLPVNQSPLADSPVNQLSLAAILTANAPVNQTADGTPAASPVNQLPVNQIPVGQRPTIIDCTKVNCASATLKQAFAAGAVLPNLTLGDLRRALAPSDVPDTWTLADLQFFGNPSLIVGDLLRSLPQPNTLTLADVLALALFANNPESFAFETLNIFETSLSLYASPLVGALYTVSYAIAPANGGAAGVPAVVAVSVTLPRTFAFAPGTARRVDGNCSETGLTLTDPVLSRLPDGSTKATWSVAGTVGNAYKLCFTARPGIVLGPQAAALASARPEGGAAVSATAPEAASVLDGAESVGNNVAATAPVLATGKLYLSYLTSASDVDYSRFGVPAAGTRTTFHLSHLPADYDLVVYGPQQTVLRPVAASTPPLDGAPLTDTGSELTHVTDALPSQTLDDLRLQTLPLVGVSASRGKDPEDITVLSDGSGGTYTVQVTSYNGATSADPYMLRVTTEAPRTLVSTPPRTAVTGATGAAVGALPTGFNTLFLVDRQRLQSFYPLGTPAVTGTGASLLSTLASTQATFQALGFPNAVLSVDAYATPVQSAYADWDSDPGNPAKANAVVKAINAIVDSEVRSKPNGAGLKYIVIVGGDRVIPQGRLGDFTTAANETGYADTFDQSSDLYANLRAGQMLSDDPYGTLEPVPYLNRQLFVPRLAVGRLVETPAEIAATLTRFGAFNGRLDPTTSLTTGYDFMQDGAAAINAPFASRFGAGAKTLPTAIATGVANWTKSSLAGSPTSAFLPTGGSAPSITSLNGHADHFEFAPPSVVPPFFTSSLDLPLKNASGAPAANTGPLVNRLVFSMGCHSGLSVSDAVVTGNTYDWPQAYAHNGVGAYLGNTGFGYGDSLVVAYSEQLDSIFARNIAAGSTVGNALAAAKQEYFGGLGVFGVYDEKAMAEFTLYGLPMWSVTMPGGGLAPLSIDSASAGSSGGMQPLAVQAAAAVPSSRAVITDAATGLQSETFVLDGIANTPHTTATPNERYWSGPDGVQVTHFRPLQPKAFVDVTGTAGHGALITELQQVTDTPGVDPVFARPIVDTQSTEPELAFGDVAFPSRLQALRTFQQGGALAQRVVLMTGQFFTGSNPGSIGTGVQRLYSRIGARVLRSSSPDFVPPAFTRIDATGVGATAAFAVDVTDLTETGAAGQVKRVLVAMRSGTATWTFADLGQVGSTARWSGGIPLPSPGASFEYFVQAVDAAGNVGVSTNKGFYFAGAAPAAPSGGVTVAPASTAVSGWFSGDTNVVVNGPPGVKLEVSIDGGPFNAVPPPIVTGDGVHVVVARGSNGGTASTLIPIDSGAPTIVIGAPAPGASYALGSTTPADFACSDAGSGVNTCTGTVSSGAPFSTDAVGTKTFTVSAADNLGNTATRSVTYNVIFPLIAFASTRTGNGDIYLADTRGGAPAQLTSGTAIDAEPTWSPDRRKIAFTSTRDGNVEIYVMNADGSGVKRLTTQSSVDAAPAWSPDGTQIAFSSNRTNGNWDIFVMDAASGANVTRLTMDAGVDTFPTWSPTGSRIAFSSTRTGAGDIYAMNANGTSQTRLTTSAAVDIEPDWFGSTIAFSTNRDGLLNFEIYTMTDSGGSLTRKTTDSKPDTSPTWSPDGTKIAFASNRPGGGNFDIFTMNANGTGQAALAAHSSLDLFPDW